MTKWSVRPWESRASALSLARCKCVVAIGTISLAGIIAGSASTAANITSEAEAAQRPPLNIALFVTSRRDECYDSGTVTAIKRLARQTQRRINAAGGIVGRRLQLNFFDDKRDPNRTIANLRAAISDPQIIAMIGLSNATRAKAAFDASGKDLKASGIPFLSNISVGDIFADDPNVFTMRASEDEERMPVLAEFVKEMHFARPAFIGLKESVASDNLGDALKTFLGSTALVADRRLATNDAKLDAADATAAISELRSRNADLVFLAVGSRRTKALLKVFKEAGFTPPLFVTGRIESFASDPTSAYANDIYQLAWDGLPDLYNARLRKLIANSKKPDAWIFEGHKNRRAPGWENGTCKPRDEDIPLDVLDDHNLRALNTGAQYADMVSLIAEAARPLGPAATVPEIRSFLVRQIGTAYAAGRGIFKGKFENWSFRPSSRAAAKTPLIVMLPRGLGQTQLAPIQFVHLRDNSLRRIDTLYADVDLVHAERIDDNAKTFLADFYLSMNDRAGASIDDIEFANAYLEPGSNDRQITVRVVHDGGKSAAFPDHMKIYHVSGKFLFDPLLKDYPFDTQRFAIDIQPKRSGATFIVQPPPAGLRDRSVTVDGWAPKQQYVGYDEDYVRTIDAQTLVPSVVPFYKASFVWQMTRQTTDYFLRVVVPLGFILIIAYLSIFISAEHFEAIVTIQVTALLSAVALYLSLTKLDANTETLSDRIFLFSYLVLSVIIAITIARANRRILPVHWLKSVLGFVHIVAIPVLVAAMVFYVYEASLG